MRAALLLTTTALLMLAPLALAQDEKPTTNDTRPEDAAWTEDCPPDMMCAYGGADEPARGPADGSCENCRGEEAPIPFGNESCIECSGPAPGQDNCMDGAQGGEVCDRDVQYFGGEPHDSGPIESHQDAETAAQTVPTLAVAGILFVAAIAVVLRRAS